MNRTEHTAATGGLSRRPPAQDGDAELLTRRVLDGLPLPLLILDGDLRIAVANQAFIDAYQTEWLEIHCRSFPEFAASLWGFSDVRPNLEDLLQSAPGATWSCDAAGGISLSLRASCFHSLAHRQLLIVLEDESERTESKRERTLLLRSIRDKELALKRTVEALRGLSERQIRTQEEDRRRVARELHDDLGQKVALLQFDISALGSELSGQTPASRQILERLEQSVSALTHDLRNIAHQIHPSILDELGLAAAIQVLAQEFGHRNGSPVRIDAENFPRFLPAPIATSLYRIAQESLRNVNKHAGPTQVDIRLSVTARRVRLEIRDYGNGFDPRTIKHGRSLGMLAMRERTRLLKGTFSVRARPTKGVVIQVGIPLGSYGSQRV